MCSSDLQNNKASTTPSVMGLKLSKEDCKKNVNLTLYKSIVGNLMYLNATRHDIMYEINLISRFMETPKETHWQAAKRILRYVNGKIEYGVIYSKNDDLNLIGHTDND